MTIQHSLLPSGLCVISDSMPDMAAVSLGLWVDVGTRYESAAQNGISHLLEHMFFKGTHTRDVKTLNRAIESVGGSLNAYTGREQTAYTARVMAEDLPLALDLLSDMMLNSRFDGEDLKRERDVIAQEIGEAYDAPDDWIFDLLHLTAYPDQALGRPVLGQVETLEAMSHQDLRAYVAAHYGANRAVLVASGKVEHAAVVALAEQYFAPLKTVAPSPYAPARYVGGEAQEDRAIEQLHLCAALEGVDWDHPLYYAQTLYTLALGGGASSRLYHEVREERGLAYSVSAFTTPYMDSALMIVYAAADPDRASELMPVLLHEIATMAKTMTSEELSRAKALARAGLLMDLESSGNRAERLAGNWLQYHRTVDIDETLAGINAVTLADIQTYAAQILKTPLTRVAVGPIGLLEPFALSAARLQEGL